LGERRQSKNGGQNAQGTVNDPGNGSDYSISLSKEESQTQMVMDTSSDSDTYPVSSRSRADVLRDLDVSLESGLDAAEVRRRWKQYGLNRLQEMRRKSLWVILQNQLKSLIVVLLLAAVVLSFAFDQWMEGAAIAAVILINTAIGFFTEARAVRSMEALQKLTRVSARVRRDGQVRQIPAEELVPGDISLLGGGDIVTADLRLLKASKLQADESALTGESVPVDKQVDPVVGVVPVAEQSNMLFKGTAVTRGSAEGVVVATGMNSELGKISSLVEQAREEATPLEKRLDQLGRNLIWVTVAIAVVVGATGILVGKETFLMIEAAIALAVAAIPEGLSIVATIALARGMWRMAHLNALVNRLSAVETLGATNAIFTDKTGTLTENLMTVTRIVLDSGEIQIDVGARDGSEFTKGERPVHLSEGSPLQELLITATLCNDASLRRESDGECGAVGDPVEVALLRAAAKANLYRDELLKETPEVREEAFDSDVKMMATFHQDDDEYRIAVKGAPESILEACARVFSENGEKEITNEDRDRWLNRNDRMADEGLRVLAFARRKVKSTEVQPYQNLTFLGLVGLADPPRAQVREAIAACRDAGINVIMVTGDQPLTARTIGLAVGVISEPESTVVHGRVLRDPKELSQEERSRILQARIFARVTPKQKLDLIAIHQQDGAIVAMTGDGVNDAPALKKADIGIAMGKRGTQVAREAADMVLKDDAFSTIVTAIEQGRVIFQNIRKFVFYLISCNVSEVMIISLASAVRVPLPILPLQILFLNLVTDVFPALAIGVGKGHSDIMKHPPRGPKEPILRSSHWLSIGGYGVIMTGSVLVAFLLAFVWLKMEVRQAVTVSFLTLAFAQLWHVFNMRDPGSSFLYNDIVRNPFVWAACAGCTALLLAAVYLPGLGTALKLTHPGAWGWTLVFIMSIIPWAIGQLMKFKTDRKGVEARTPLI